MGTDYLGVGRVRISYVQDFLGYTGRILLGKTFPVFGKPAVAEGSGEGIPIPGVQMVLPQRHFQIQSGQLPVSGVCKAQFHSLSQIPGPVLGIQFLGTLQLRDVVNVQLGVCQVVAHVVGNAEVLVPGGSDMLAPTIGKRALEVVGAHVAELKVLLIYRHLRQKQDFEELALHACTGASSLVTKRIGKLKRVAGKRVVPIAVVTHRYVDILSQRSQRPRG